MDAKKVQLTSLYIFFNRFYPFSSHPVCPLQWIKPRQLRLSHCPTTRNKTKALSVFKEDILFVQCNNTTKQHVSQQLHFLILYSLKKNEWITPRP